MSRHPPTPEQSPPATSSPVWAPVEPDPDLEAATSEDPALKSWIDGLRSQAQATMDDNAAAQLYSQAPDALRRAGTEVTPEAIDTWVQEHLGQHQT